MQVVWEDFFRAEGRGIRAKGRGKDFGRRKDSGREGTRFRKRKNFLALSEGGEVAGRRWRPLRKAQKQRPSRQARMAVRKAHCRVRIERAVHNAFTARRL